MKKIRIGMTGSAVFFLICCLATSASAADPRLKNLGNGICQDTESGLMWQVQKSKTFKDQENAVQYTKELDLGGYADWRLPTVDERKYLKKEVYDLKKNGDCDLEKPDGNYWTEDQENGLNPGRLDPNDECGGGYKFLVKKKGRVRAVRP